MIAWHLLYPLLVQRIRQWQEDGHCDGRRRMMGERKRVTAPGWREVEEVATTEIGGREVEKVSTSQEHEDWGIATGDGDWRAREDHY